MSKFNSASSIPRRAATLLLIGCIAWVGAACNPKNAGFLAGKNNLTTTPVDKKNHDDDAEKVDIPANVSGSYLVCALRKEASATDLKSEYGCRLSDAGTQGKLDLGPNQQNVSWSSNQPEHVSIELKPAADIYHARYVLTGPNTEAITSLANSLEIQVQWQTPGGAGSVPIKRQNLLEILKPAASVGDSTAPVLQGQGLDPTDPGTL